MYLEEVLIKGSDPYFLCLIIYLFIYFILFYVILSHR